MSSTKPGNVALPMAHLATVADEHTDRCGYLHSTTALHFMGHAAVAIAARLVGERLVALSTERVAFKRPVPVGQTIAFQGSLTRSEDGNLRVSIEGVTRPSRNEPSSCAMSGSFLLGAIDPSGQLVSLPLDHPALAVA